jgi:hypothetical protein
MAPSTERTREGCLSRHTPYGIIPPLGDAVRLTNHEGSNFFRKYRCTQKLPEFIVLEAHVG